MTTQHPDTTARTAALVTGFALLSMAVFALFANFFVLERLVVTGDAATTTTNIADAQGLFRLATASFLIVAILDVVVAAALYVFLKPVNERLALLMASLRLVYAGMLGVAVLNLALVSDLAGGADHLAALDPEQTQAQVMFFLEAFGYGWLIGFIFFGLHLLVLGYLVARSGYMPRVLGVLLMIAAAGYGLDSFANLLLSNYADYETIFLVIVAVPAMAEFLLAFWLLFRGGRSSAPQELVLDPA